MKQRRKERERERERESREKKTRKKKREITKSPFVCLCVCERCCGAHAMTRLRTKACGALCIYYPISFSKKNASRVHRSMMTTATTVATRTSNTAFLGTRCVNKRRGVGRDDRRRRWSSTGASCSSIGSDDEGEAVKVIHRRKALLAASGLVLGTKCYEKSINDDNEEAKAFIDLPSRLHNRYFLVRHGESTLDVRNQILSNPSYKYDTTYGLTAKGVEQVHEAARIILEEYDGSPSWLYTSNFQRSFQTALVMREDLGLLFSEVRTEFSGLLDPRKMGSLDFQDRSNWKEVWENDLRDPLSTPPPVSDSLQPSASVESVRDLYRRTLEAFTRLEASYFGTDIVLVSHADTLSCFCAALYGTDLGRHHLDYPFELGQVRCVDMSGIPGKGSKVSPTDIQGEYAVGDKAVNYL